MQPPPVPSPPIAACLLGLDPLTPDGTAAHLADEDFWRSQLATVKEVGFDFVEISDAWLNFGVLSPRRIARLRAVLADLDLTPIAVHSQRRSVADPRDGEANLAHHHRALDNAAALGVGIYLSSYGLHRPLTPAQQRALWFWTVAGPVDDPDPAVREVAVRRVRELGDHAAELGLTTSLELYEDTYLGTGQDAVRFIIDVDRDNVGLNPDVGNLIRLHRPVEAWQELYELTLPYATYWHAKNYLRDEAADQSWFSAMPATLRDGLINYRAVIRRAVELGYPGPITCEHYGGDSLGVAAANRAYLVELFATLDTTQQETLATKTQAAASKEQPS